MTITDLRDHLNTLIAAGEGNVLVCANDSEYGAYETDLVHITIEPPDPPDRGGVEVKHLLIC